MSGKEDDQARRLERARAIGLFRYMLIREAADQALTGRQRGRLVRQIAAVPHTDPDGRTVRISRWTLDRWILDWRKSGFDALVPSPRQSVPRTPPEVFELATALKKENPDRTAAQIRRILQAQHGWAPDERTLQRMFVRTGLTALRAPAQTEVFGRFEAERPNALWTGDALHGPRIDGRKTYLFAFIDDHSRQASLEAISMSLPALTVTNNHQLLRSAVQAGSGASWIVNLQVSRVWADGNGELA